MRIRVEGPRAARRSPLVFIHGAGGSATVWLDVFRHFERTRLVVAPDLPAHGQSDPFHVVPDAARISHHGEVVGAVCARLGVKKAILVGHSMGGLVALSAAAAYPDKVAGVVLLAAALEMKPAPALLDAIEQNPSRQAEILAELGWSPATPRDTVLRWMRTTTSADPAVTSADLRAVSAFAPPRGTDVHAPIACLGGEDDLLCPPMLVRNTAATFARGEHQLFPDAGHFLHLEHPAATITAIERFAANV